MRKYQQFTQSKYKSKVPTIIIMVITLSAILLFGKSFSDNVAELFAPNIPVSDQNAVVPVSDSDQINAHNLQNIIPNSATIVAQAYKNAAQSILPVLAKGNQP